MPRTSKRAVDPRKRPTQARSRATVDAIMIAAAQVFERLGYVDTTTDLIAERAGVSIGTLYQYFPSKDALLKEMFERHLMAMAQSLAPFILALDGSTTLLAFLRDFTSRYFAVHRASPRLHQVLMEEAPIPEALFDRMLEMEDSAAQGIAAYLREMPEVQRDPRVAATMLMTTAEALTHRFTIHPPLKADVEQLEGETVTMLHAYLTAPKS